MYSVIRNEDYPNIKPTPDSEEPVVVDAELALDTSRDPDSDEYLLIVTGNTQDTEAFSRLFQRYSSKIYAMGMKLTRNEQLSKDLVQEAMLNVWRKARLYDLDRGSAQSWIFTMTRNRCFDMLRKIKRQPNCLTAEEKGSLAAEASIIAGYCGKLPKLQQDVIEQIYILDRTHEEAAAILEIPLGTLKSRLRLGISRLKLLIGVDQ
jgi:RNA polymerase sigma-70 factor (ECF subfamily)